MYMPTMGGRVCPVSPEVRAFGLPSQHHSHHESTMITLLHGRRINRRPISQDTQTTGGKGGSRAVHPPPTISRKSACKQTSC